MFHELGQVERIENVRGGVIIQGRLPGRLLARYSSYTKSEKEGENL
jgi:GTP-binding protein HflX